MPAQLNVGVRLRHQWSLLKRCSDLWCYFSASNIIVHHFCRFQCLTFCMSPWRVYKLQFCMII